MDNTSAPSSKPNSDNQDSEHDLRDYSREELIAAWGLCRLNQGGSARITPIYRAETEEDQSLPGAAETRPKKRKQKDHERRSPTEHRVCRVSLLSHDPLRTSPPSPLNDENVGPENHAELAPIAARDSISSDELPTYAAHSGNIWTNEEKARLERIVRRLGGSNWRYITGEFNMGGQRMRSIDEIQRQAYRQLDPPLQFDSNQHSDEAEIGGLNLFNDADDEEDKHLDAE